MLAFISNILFLFAGATKAGESAFTKFYNEYLNIPGFEVWKFINLAIFVGIMIYLLKKPLSEAFDAKRDAIRAELIKAEEEKKAAQARLTTIEGKLAQLDTEKENILQKAKAEAEFEKNRLAEQTESDAERLKAQADAELIRLGNQSRVGLRRFSAEESIKLAEAKIRAQITGESDSRLIKSGIAEIGGLN